MQKTSINQIVVVIWLPLLLAFDAHAVCTKPLAKVVSAQGQVHRQVYGTRNWLEVRQGDALCPGDMLRTSRLSRATIIQPTGSGLTLEQNTALTFNLPKVKETETNWFLRLFNGKIFIRGRKPERYDVNTPFVNAVHKGTEFLVEVDDKKTAITVYDGLVVGENAQGKAEAKPGQAVIAEAGGAPRVRSITVRPEDAVQWALYYPPVIDLGAGQEQVQAKGGKQPLTVRPEPAPQALPSVVEGPDLSHDEGLGQGLKQSTVRPEPVEGQNQKPTAADNNLAPAINAYRQGNINDALAELEKIPQGRQNAQYLTLKAALLLTVGRVDEAQPIISQAQQQQPNNPDALSLQAIIAVTKNRQQQALDLASKAVNNNPGSSTAQIAKSYAEQSLFKLEDAIQSTRKATQLNPNNALAWARLSELELSQGDHDKALKAAQKAQQINPKLARTQTVLGFADLAETEIDQAKQQFQQALTLDSTDPLARLGLGLAKIRQGDVEEGKNELETAANLDPNNAIIRSYLGKSYYELRNQDYAATEYDIAKKLDPKDPTPYFYDAILKQTTNRPVEALHDMQKAIELNDNRGVYRSKLLLDKDSATRTANQARIYNDLGFGRVALKQAWNALSYDSINPTAHRFLSDAYIGQPRFRVARASELLQAQLLQPINITPVQPQLTTENISILNSTGPGALSVNEYDPLYNANGAHIVLNGAYGSRNTKTDNAIVSGVYNNFSGSLGQFHYQTDGFRQNDDYQQDIYNVFVQYAFSPKFTLQGELKTETTESGDVPLRLNGFHDPDLRQTIKQDTARIGGHYKIDSKQDLIASFMYTTRLDSNIDSNFYTSESTGRKANVEVFLSTENSGHQTELQYLYHDGNFDVTAGFGYLNLKNDVIDSTNDDFISPPFDPFIDKAQANSQTNHFNGYIYSKQYLFEGLTTILGASFESLSTDLIKFDWLSNHGIPSPPSPILIDRQQINPKFGIIWNPIKNLTLRGAAFRTLKRQLAANQTIEPTQIAGFNQLFDDNNGASAWRYGFGLDYQPIHSIFMGGEVSWRDTKQPFTSNGVIVDQDRNEYSHLAYIYWTPTDQASIKAEYNYEKIRRDFVPSQGSDVLPQSVATHTLPISFNFFHSNGFFSKITGTYVNQRVSTITGNTQPGWTLNQQAEDFWTFDAAIGYRFPKKFGTISFEARNLFDNKFNFQSTFDASGPQLSPFVPERQLFAKINLFF